MKTLDAKKCSVAKFIRLCRLMMPVTLVAAAGMSWSCSEKDELMDEPSWLGNSIYDRLQEDGNYSYTLRLIDDLGQKDVLSQTGSKTLFVADDGVFNNFFSNNTWNVGRYEDLSEAQKKLLFNSSMVNNAYLIELLSNVSGDKPLEGQCMRRETAASVFDSISRILPAEMPNTPFWTRHKSEPNGIVLLRDNTSKPMIHFLPAFMKHNKITDEDLSILTNGVSQSVSDSWVNGKKVVQTDITCKNGYIHKMEGLATAADNMAEIIHSNPDMSRFASLIDRFCAPYYDDAATKEYNRLYKNEDKVYTLKYFSSNSNINSYGNPQGGELTTDPDDEPVDAYLAFDPGWNQYIYSNTAGYDLHYDCGAILVPNNEAFNYWWNHDGKVLQDMYGTWENVPMKVLVKLLDIDFIRSFTETVPSKFNNILDNTNKVPIGLKKTDVEKCYMGCNGVVYKLSKVFTPASYSSVSFPALVNEETMNIVYWAIENLGFEPYLNSMDSYYSFVIPTNNAMLTYIDPCTYGKTTTILYQFYYNQERKSVGAHRFVYDTTTKSVKTDADDLTDASEEQVKNRLRDLLNNLIVIGDVESGHTYYHTKEGCVLKVENAGNPGAMTISGGYQIEENCPVAVSAIYDQSRSGNGKAYIVDQSMPLSSQKSLYSILNNRENCTRFFELMTQGSNNSNAYALMKGTTGSYAAMDYNCMLFDAFNYTVYVPTDASLDSLHNLGQLPYWSDYAALAADQFGGNATKLKHAQDSVANIILNFVKYHIQDNSIFIGGDSIITKAKFETSTLNNANKRFYSITVSADDNNITITDQLNNTCKVVKGNNYNIIGREYWIENANNANNTQNIYNASDVVVHQIDGVLLYHENQRRKWQDIVDAIK